MKIIAAFLIMCFVVSAWGEEPTESRGRQVAEAPGTNSALRQAMTAFNWSWENVVNGPKSFESIQFYQDGLARNPEFFDARWEAIGPQTIALRLKNSDDPNDEQIAYLVFDATFTHYIGIDFNGKTNVEGFRREAVNPARTAPAGDNK